MSHRDTNPNNLPSVKAFVKKHGRKPNWLIKQDEINTMARYTHVDALPRSKYIGPVMTREELLHELLQ